MDRNSLYSRATRSLSMPLVRRIVLLVALLLLAFLSFSCNQERTEPPSVKVLPRGNVNGRIWSKSDVQTIPDSPIPAAVLVMTSDAHDSILTSATLSESEFGRLVVAHSVSDSAGQYSVDVMPGNLWICLASVGEADPRIRFPLRVAGCVPVLVSPAEARRKDLFVGEGGVSAGP